MCYTSSKPSPSLIASRRIVGHIQAIATLAYIAASKLDLKFSPLLSLSVCAVTCVFIRKGGYIGPFIKIHLRWKCDIFLICLWNITQMLSLNLWLWRDYSPIFLHTSLLRVSWPQAVSHSTEVFNTELQVHGYTGWTGSTKFSLLILNLSFYSHLAFLLCTACTQTWPVLRSS